jgi:hypothetical protein
MIRKSLYKLFRWVNNYGSIPVPSEESNYITSKHVFNKKMSSSSDGIAKEGMNFTIHPAAGGYILEYRVYDHPNERSNNKLHIINEDQDLGECIGKIITLEILRN